MRGNWWFEHKGILLLAVVATGAAGAGCTGTDGGPLGVAIGSRQAAATAAAPEDALAEAYGIFKQTFVNDGENRRFHLGYGFHPGLSSAKILVDGAPVSGQATLDFEAGVVTATLHAPTEGAGFDLYFVKNAVGRGTVKPERGDDIVKVGRFTPDNRFGPNQHSLSATVGSAPFPAPGVNFDLDLVVVTRAGEDPTRNVIAAGARTLFEKRFFRERAGASLDPVTGTLADDVETTDPLVRRGSQLFFAETFGGNGRTCGTCHRLENNLTIDPAFVAKLPADDPLFVVPDGLEDPALLAQAMIRENIDGFDQPRLQFVERSVPHTLAMSTSIGEVATGLGMNNAPTTGIDGSPPDQRTGWSGDGAPGRGTLQEFAFGAIVQHFTRSLARVPGSDFRIPTQTDLDALEAFQRFSGRQRNVLTPAIGFGDPAAQAGRDSMLNEAQCVACHRDIVGDPATNFNFDTGVEHLALPFRTAVNMPTDGGFGTARNSTGNDGTVEGGTAARFGNGRFNVPPLFEAADTAPLFHNNGAATIEDAVAFYASAEFIASPGSSFARPFLTTDNIANIAGFLRTINALTNIAQVRKRVAYLAGHATPGGARILRVAIADTNDAIRDLSVPALHAPATTDALVALRTVALTLENTLPFADNPPSAPLTQALAWLELARRDLAPTNPNADF